MVSKCVWGRYILWWVTNDYFQFILYLFKFYANSNSCTALLLNFLPRPRPLLYLVFHSGQWYWSYYSRCSPINLVMPFRCRGMVQWRASASYPAARVRVASMGISSENGAYLCAHAISVDCTLKLYENRGTYGSQYKWPDLGFRLLTFLPLSAFTWRGVFPCVISHLHFLKSSQFHSYSLIIFNVNEKNGGSRIV